MELAAYVFFIALLAGSAAVGFWLENKEKQREGRS